MENGNTVHLNNAKTFKPVTSLHGITFKVEDYQRGFKWGDIEITIFLNDLQKHDSNKGPYCLQPIIVKPVVDNEYEVIDGQQRLTSLYLLMQYLTKAGDTIQYSIEYNTREQSQCFLKNTANFKAMADSESWMDFKLGHPEYNNVDIFHFYEVYHAIQNWFSTGKDEKAFLKKLSKNLYIIWYDVTKGNLAQNASSSAENIFINFNANKVDLSSSELIKALFILDHEATLTKEQKKHNAIELALEWDAIENKLQDNTFWYFICNNDKYNHSATRIDFIFDLVVNKVGAKDKLESYRTYEKIIISEKAKEEEWKKIKTLFYKLDEWYSDNEMYHYVGYLIVTGLSNIQTVLKESDNENKDDFKNLLIQKIRTEFQKQKEGKMIYDIDILSYENKKACNNVLLLLNVHHYLKDASSNKFPFNLYQEHNWSLEHINPQNPQDITDLGMFKEWISTVETFFTTGNNKEVETTKTFNAAINYLKEKSEAVDRFEAAIKVQDFKDIVNQVSDMINVHNITNLALLDRNTNSALGNNNYLIKREIILRFDRKGCDDSGALVFIPVCTRDLFTKTYSYLTKENVDTYFTAIDMRDYKAYIIEELHEFLSTQIPGNATV